MSILFRTLALLCCAGTAQAATLTFAGYNVLPNRQQAQVSVHMSLGYPVGEADVGLILDCRSGKVDILEVGTGGDQYFLGQPAMPAGSTLKNAVLKSGLISIKPGVLNINFGKEYKPLISQCQNGVLDSPLLDQADQLQTGNERHVQVVVGSRETLPEPGPSLGVQKYQVDALTVALTVSPGRKAGYVIGDYSTDGAPVALGPPNTIQIILSDGKHLYPVYYSGAPQSNAAVQNLAIPTTLIVYSTYDGKHWVKTLVDFAQNRMRTVPSAKPTLPVRS